MNRDIETFETFPILLPSPEEMARMDAITIQGGVSSDELMKKAGLGVCEVLTRIYPVVLDNTRSTLILCGAGNNGGDGLVVARELHRLGAHPCVILIAAEKYSDECSRRLKEYQSIGGEVLLFGDKPADSVADIPEIDTVEFSNSMAQSRVVVDALLGTGQRSDPRGAIGELLKLMEPQNTTAGHVAIDIPTGVNSDTGEVYPLAFRADHTIAIEFIKRGMIQQPAVDLVGELHFVTIDIDTSSGAEFSLLNSHTLSRLSPRPPQSHKFTFGHTLVVGGCREMPGAPVLAGMAALRGGSGLVSIASGAGVGSRGAYNPELLHVDVGNGMLLVADDVDSISRRFDRITSVVIGPGMGTAPESVAFLDKFLESLKSSQIQTVIDADALNVIAEQGWDFNGFNCAPIVTPHPGEAARLLDITTAEVQHDRYRAAQMLMDKLKGAVIVLKGPASIVVGKEGGRVNLTGSHLLATAGSGDVLAGLIAAVYNQGVSAFDAACAGVYAHGLAGDLAGEMTGGTIIATDIIGKLPAAVSTLRD